MSCTIKLSCILQPSYFMCNRKCRQFCVIYTHLTGKQNCMSPEYEYVCLPSVLELYLFLIICFDCHGLFIWLLFMTISRDTHQHASISIRIDQLNCSMYLPMYLYMCTYRCNTTHFLQQKECTYYLLKLSLFQILQPGILFYSTSKNII